MQSSVEVVKDKEGGNWEVTISLPESLEEAKELYGDDGVLSLFNAGLKVKLQAIARTNFKQGKDRAEIEQMMAEYRPGRTTRKGNKQRAMELIVENAARFMDDPDLKEAVEQAMYSNKWGDVISLLSE